MTAGDVDRYRFTAAAGEYATPEDTPLTVQAPGVLGNDKRSQLRRADGGAGCAWLVSKAK